MTDWQRMRQNKLRFDIHSRAINVLINVCSNTLEQIDEIINRMVNDSRIEYDLDWKVFSLLVGQNDLCYSCDGTVRKSHEATILICLKIF